MNYILKPRQQRAYQNITQHLPQNLNRTEMKNFIEYLSNDAWIKTFKKPANETDFKVKKWFKRKEEELDHWVAFGKTSEGLSYTCP